MNELVKRRVVDGRAVPLSPEMGVDVERVELADRRVEVVVTSGSGASEPAQPAGELGDGHGRAYRLVLEELPPLRSGSIDAELCGSLLAERGGVARSKGRDVYAN